MTADARDRSEPRDDELDPPTGGRNRLPRRRFLGMLAGGAAAVGAGGIAARVGVLEGAGPPSPDDEELARRQWVMVFDLRRCDGCERCTEACNEMHYLPEDQPWIKVHELRDATGQTYYMPRPCMQCESPPCVRVCPVQATYRVGDGVTLVDQARCIGCRMCMAACPYEARTFSWDEPLEAPASPAGPSPEFPVPQQRGTAGKCVLCVHDIRYGKLPACVRRCHNGAIYLGDFNTDVATNGKETVRLSALLEENDAQRLREELGTRPRVYYIAGHGQDADDDS